MEDQVHNQIAQLMAQISELAEAVALTNERLNKILTESVTSEYDSLENRTYLKLGIKKIEQLTKEEILELNEKVMNRQSGKRVQSSEASKALNGDEALKFYEEQYGSYKDKGYEDSLVSLAKHVIRGLIADLEESEASRKANEVSGSES